MEPLLVDIRKSGKKIFIARHMVNRCCLSQLWCKASAVNFVDLVVRPSFRRVSHIRQQKIQSGLQRILTVGEPAMPQVNADAFGQRGERKQRFEIHLRIAK